MTKIGVLYLTLFVLVFAVTSPAIPQPEPDDCILPFFQAPRLFSAGAPIDRAAIADFNHDGNRDVAVVSFDSSFIAVFQGDGAGNFGVPTILPAGDFSVPIATADFDHDGNADLSVGSRDGFVWIYLGDGTGGFGPVSKYADGGGEAYDIAVADFDHDGNTDLAIAHQFRGLGILLGNGNGGFSSPTTFNDGAGPVEVDPADFDNDGNIDLIMDNAQGGNASVFLGDGSGGFAVHNLLMPRPGGFGIGDLSGDGNVDIVVTDSGGYVLRIGDGLGGFGAPTFLSSGGGKAKVADFNGDGRPDVAGTTTSTDGSWQVFILYADGAGGFQLPIAFPTGSAPPGDFEVADLNDDGKPDIVMINQYGGNISVLINNNGSLDITPPVISVSDNMVDATGPEGAVVSYSLSAVDDSGRVAGLSCDIPPGSTFPVGTTPILCTTADYCGNSGSQNFNIDVVDQPPVLSLPNGVTVGDACPSGKVVSYSATATDVVSGNLPVSCSPSSGSNFPLGQTTVTCSATDGGGNTSTGTFSVNVIEGSAASFEPVRAYSANNAEVFRSAAGDFNADGKMDLAVTSPGVAAIFYGDGTGNFTEPFHLPAAGFNVPLASGDFNHDGKTDLVVGGGGYAWVYLNNGSSGLGQPTLWPANNGDYAYEIAIADLNSDGNQDLAIGHQFTGLAILFGDGNGGFGEPVEYIDGNGPVQVSKADFNNDGNVDLITANSSTGDVSVLINNGDGTFSVSSPSIPPTDFGIGDFDSDGKTDVVTANDDSSVRIYFGDGNGGFTPGGSFPTSGSSPGAIKSADINGDGKLDIVVANGWPETVSVLLGDNHGAFSSPFTFPVSSGPSSVTIADVDANGKPDIAAGAYFAGGLSVLVNSTDHTTGPACDQVAPSTMALPSATPNGAGWNNSDVTISLSATDNAGGSGVSDITYSASGAQSIPSTIVSGAAASLSITAEGTTTVTYNARDNGGNIEPAHFLILRIDKTAPAIAITSPANGAVYQMGQSVNSNYGCSDTESGFSSCAGTVANGNPVDTATTGTKSFSVISTDTAGNTRTFTNTYNVILPPFTDIGPAQVWVGLKNSDDVGTKFDLLAEVLRNGVVIGSGQLNDINGGSSGFNNARLNVFNLALSQPTGVGPGDTLSFRLSVRVAASSGHVSGTARLWFNDAAANSRFAVTIGGVTNSQFLRSGFLLGTSAGSGPKSSIDVLVNRNIGGNPFKPFCTWNITY